MRVHYFTRSNRWWMILLLPLMLAVILLQVRQAGAQEYAYQEDFEDGQAQDWTLDPDWQVIQDAGNYVLSGQGHTWARADKVYDDYRLSFRLKLLKGRVHLNYRMNDTGRYFIGFETQGSDLNKQYWPDTFFNNLVRKGWRHTANEWHQIEIAGQGNTLTFTVDGNTEWTYTDPEPILIGGFAFETLDNSQVYIDDIKVELAASSAFHVDQAIASLTWTRTGGPLGGLGYDVRMRPDNPDIMYVTDAKAGVFKSTDGGKTWIPKNNGITTRGGMANDEIPVFCLTIDPSNYDVLWAGTLSQAGLFKSTDAGETWNKMDNGVVERSLTTRGFGVDPHNSNVVYAAGEVASWEWFGQSHPGREFDRTRGVVYKTTNGGQSWKKVWEGDNLARYIWIDPRDTNVIYVSTGIFDREAANSDLLNGVQGGVGVLKSTDGGQTWQQINNGLQNLYVGSLFMHPQNPDILLAGTGAGWQSPGAGVYLTTDGGQTWRQTLSVNLNTTSVEFVTSNPQIAYAGGFRDVWRSTDGGQTWELRSGSEEGDGGWGTPGTIAGIPFDFQVDPRNPERIFSNQYGGGNFISLDGGKTWDTASKGYTGAAIRDIAVDPTQPGRVIAASRSGIFASYNGGEDWMGLSFKPFYFPDWHVIAMDPQNPRHLIAGMTCKNNLIVSSDEGMSWRQTEQFPEGSQKAFAAIAFAPTAPQTVYAGSAGYISCGHFTSDVPGSGWNPAVKKPGAGVFVSHDGGENWQQSPDLQMQDLAVNKLAVDPQNALIVYAATFYSGLYRSDDGGESWSQVEGGLPTDKSITTVRIDPHDNNIIYAGRNQGGLYRSLDGGTTWTQVSAGLPAEGVITDVEFDPQNPQVLYAAEGFSGIYRSQDGGKNWQALNNGLSVRTINALSISSDGQHLYAASEGMGVFRLDLNGQPPQAAPTPLPIPSPTSPATAVPSSSAPTQEPPPTASNPLCGGAMLLPVLMFGIAWLFRYK